MNGMALLRRLWKLIMAGTTQLASTLRFMSQLEHENVDHHVQQLARETSVCPWRAQIPSTGTGSLNLYGWCYARCAECSLFDYFFLLFP